MSEAVSGRKNGRHIVDESTFHAFVSETRRLNSLPALNAVELDYSARHLAMVLKLKGGVKVLMSEEMHDERTEEHAARLLGTFSSKGDLGIRNLIKISKSQSKLDMIDTFVHEMFHKFQHADVDAFQRAIMNGSFEKDTYTFTNSVMKECGLQTTQRRTA